MYGLTEEWYSAPPLRLGRHDYVRFRARTPWIVLSHRADFLGEHARWAMGLTFKYNRPSPWRIWTVKDLRPVMDVQTFQLGPVERVLGRVLAVWAALAAIR